MKVREAIELSFGVLSGVGPSISVLENGPHPPRGRRGLGLFTGQSI